MPNAPAPNVESVTRKDRHIRQCAHLLAEKAAAVKKIVDLDMDMAVFVLVSSSTTPARMPVSTPSPALVVNVAMSSQWGGGIPDGFTQDAEASTSSADTGCELAQLQRTLTMTTSFEDGHAHQLFGDMAPPTHVIFSSHMHF